MRDNALMYDVWVVTRQSLSEPYVASVHGTKDEAQAAAREQDKSDGYGSSQVVRLSGAMVRAAMTLAEFSKEET